MHTSVPSEYSDSDSDSDSSVCLTSKEGVGMDMAHARPDS